MSTAVAETPVSTTDETFPREMTAEQQQIFDEIVQDMSDLHPKIKEAEQLLVSKTAEHKAAKELLESRRSQLSDLSGLLHDAMHGIFQQRLPFGKDGEQRSASEPLVDEGGKQPVAALVEFGITENMAEVLVEQAECGTVCQIEQLIATNPVWHRDIKGFGEKKIDKLTDAIVEFRKKFPVPQPGESSEQPVETHPHNRNGHILYVRSDKDAPDSIKDVNGDIALELCKVCGRGEVELDEQCDGANHLAVAGEIKSKRDL